MDRSTVAFIGVILVVAGLSVGFFSFIGHLIDFDGDEEIYDITYNLDGGVNSPDNPSTYVYGDKIELCDPTKDGYIFEGWYIYDDLGEIKRIYRIDPLMYGDITIYATWSINLVGKTMNYDVTGEIYNQQNSFIMPITTTTHTVTGSYTLSYLSYDYVRGYNVNYYRHRIPSPIGPMRMTIPPVLGRNPYPVRSSTMVPL